MSEETWGALCDSLKTHPTLEVLHLRPMPTDATMAKEVIKSRIRKAVEMLKVNKSIHTMHLYDPFNEHDLFRGSVIPYLETNRLRPRLLAIQQSHPIPYRVKVLGRALLAAHTNANIFWMLLSGNAEVAFPSRNSTIAAAASPPMTAAIVATSTANVAALAASVMPALTTTATGSLPTATVAAATNATTPSDASDDFAFDSTVAAAANAAAPSAGEKRKARP
jgi:hypothetical protein